MRALRKVSATAITFVLALGTTFANVIAADAAQLDVGYLQTCLKTEGASLDVLVLMDSSKSLRDAKPGEDRNNPQGSDNKNLRGPILLSSLKILRTLASESKSDFNISLRNFGKNSDPKELSILKDRWQPWTSETSDGDLKNFVDKALYNDSPGTEWAGGLASAKNQFKQRLGEAQANGTQSCPIMFWITDGEPSGSYQQICELNNDSSIEWFRQNNILVLGGLLKPRGEEGVRASELFQSYVIGDNCAENRDGWTRGEVIEADDVSALAWKFVGLIANIKNLVNLNGDGTTINVDPSTSHIEIYARHLGSTWSVKKPDGSEFCSSAHYGAGTRCELAGDPVTGITTIKVYPELPIKAAGPWTLTPALNTDDFLAYGGLNTGAPLTLDRDAELKVSGSSDAEEGKSTNFHLRLQNSDGSAFNMTGFKSIQICAKLQSSSSSNCKSGQTEVDLSVSPLTSDKSVAFEAVLVSAKDDSRVYRVTASARISVLPNGLFPRLSCDGDPCKFANLANKNSKAVTKLEVQAPQPGAENGRILLKDYKILTDDATDRGDGHFFFQVTRANGQIINWGDPSQELAPGEKLTLTVTTDQAGAGDVQGILTYEVIAGNEKIERQLSFNFGVSNAKNWPVLIALMLLAYLLTVGIPYLFLLYSAKKNAHFLVPDEQLAYMQVPVVITEDGKLASSTPEGLVGFVTPAHQNLQNVEVEATETSIDLGQVHFEVIPPKWNPFTESRTTVSIAGHHLLSTYGGTEFKPNEAYFSQMLVGEALIYFATEENLAPVSKTEVISAEPASKTELFATASETTTKEELVQKTGAISATALFIVPRYGNRKKSVDDLTMKFKNTCEGASLKDHLAELRAGALSAVHTELPVVVPPVPEPPIDEPQEEEKEEIGTSGIGSIFGDEPEEPKKPSITLFDDEPKNESTKWGDDSSGSSGGKSLW